MVNQARLDAELIRQVADRLLAGQVPANNVCLLLRGKVPA
jgi:hypothetical protein